MTIVNPVSPLGALREAVASAALTVRGDAGPPHAGLRVERPKRAGQGDYSTNAAMLLAPVLGASPREIAEQIGTALATELGDDLVGYEVASSYRPTRPGRWSPPTASRPPTVTRSPGSSPTMATTSPASTT
jgi:hypothetical protein